MKLSELIAELTINGLTLQAGQVQVELGREFEVTKTNAVLVFNPTPEDGKEDGENESGASA